MHANYLLNHLSTKEGTTEAGKFRGSDHILSMTNCHTFGCPVYMLEDPLQTAGGKLPKWDSQVRLGIYLGQPQHMQAQLLSCSAH
jgi:hypothetical protein